MTMTDVFSPLRRAQRMAQEHAEWAGNNSVTVTVTLYDLNAALTAIDNLRSENVRLREINTFYRNNGRQDTP